MSLVATGVATAAMGFGESFAAWLALRAVAGVASAWALIFASAWCLDRLARSGRPGLGGIAFAGLVCVALMAVDARSHEAWIVLGALALIAAALLWPMLGAAAGTPRRAPSPSGRFRWNGERVRFALCYCALGMAYIIPATFLPGMAKAALGDPTLFRWAWPIFGAASLIGAVAAGRWQARIGNLRLWQGSHLAMAAGVILPILPLGFSGIAGGSLLVGGGFVVATMAALAEAREVGGARAERFIAVMTAALALGQVAGPLVVSALVERIGTFTPALIAASVLLVASAAGLAGGPRAAARAVASNGGER